MEINDLMEDYHIWRIGYYFYCARSKAPVLLGLGLTGSIVRVVSTCFIFKLTPGLCKSNLILFFIFFLKVQQISIRIVVIYPMCFCNYKDIYIYSYEIVTLK